MKKLLLVLCVLLMLVGCESESANVKYHVGVLQLLKHNALDKATQGFVDVLNEEFGEEIKIDIEYAAGESSNCATIANGFVAEGVDLIMANATPAVQACAHATNSIPVLGTSVTDYGIALKIDNFNGVVGSNVSGTSDLAPLDEQAKMIIELLPETKTVGLIYCSAEDNSKVQVDAVKEYLENMGVKAVLYPFADSNELNQVCVRAVDEIDVLYVPTDNVCADNGSVIANVASSKNIPIITGEHGTCVSCDGVATLSIDYYELGRQTGQMAVDVLKNGKDIKTMKIEYYNNPVKEFNKEACEKFNIVVPSDYVVIGE